VSERFVVGVVGNPNCGKTTLFNALTGTRQRVGNWPGVTVERKIGRFEVDGVEIDLVDLPDTYSLEAVDDSIPVDEQIARDYVAGREADLIVNIVDASNLERNLYLTSQLLEMKVPMVVALNMVDVAAENGLEIDVPKLAERLDCPVAPLVAASGDGVAAFRTLILEAARAKRVSAMQIRYPQAVETAITNLLPVVESVTADHGVDARWLAIRLLEGDTLALEVAGQAAVERAQAERRTVEESLGEDIDIALADARYSHVSGILDGALRRKRTVTRSMSDRIDRVVLNRALGIPIFLLAMHLMFMFTINVGGAFIDAFDIVTGAIAVDGFAALLGALSAPEWLIVLLANGIGGGIQVVATFIPIIAFLFLFLSVLEDSGYMARAAFVMDRFSAQYRPAGQVLRAADRRVRLHGAGGHGHPHAGDRARPADDDCDGALHVMRRAATGLCAVRRGVLRGLRPIHRLPALPHRHRRRGADRADPQAHASARAGDALCHGAAALSCPDDQGRDDPHL
jgi:ferrous iron transport protein B